MNRRRFLKAAGVTAGVAVAALAADAAFVETRRLTVTRHRVHSPGTNAAGRAARVVLITDLHLRSVGRFHEHIAHEIARADPQLIVISGDSVDRDDTLPLLDDFLSLLDPATPKFATWGNWEHYIGIDLRTIAEIYARHGCRVLDNESAVAYVNGARLLITGLDSSQDGKPNIPKALRGVEPSANHLVVAHCPVQRDHVVGYLRHDALAGSLHDPAAAVHTPSLVLSGHTHGGQITFGGWAPVTPAGSGPYVAGWYHDAPIPLYVSRGIGETMIPMRFCCPPELAVFEWVMRGGA
jgi:predicted MPP superfamily phosphohydrolase